MLLQEARDVLENYVAGKDQDRFNILESIYLSDATVTFEIEPTSISFPPLIQGKKEIARVLSADFNRNYTLVKTYYLSDAFPDIEKSVIRKQRWLVLMAAREDSLIKIGTGSYDWEFDRAEGEHLKIKHHHIFIRAMISLPNTPLSFLLDLQSALPYPWVKQQTVVEVLKTHKELKEISDWLIE